MTQFTLFRPRFFYSISKTVKPTYNLNITNKMPRSSKQRSALKEQRIQIKEKNQKYTPGIVNVQVLGSGANGAPRSVYIFTDQSRYMFNCGEGTQRLAHEHKMKLSKLEHIFFTYGSWENIGGLPGLSLTIQDVGVPEITVHGPPGIVDIFSATRRFIVLRDLCVKSADTSKNLFFEDNVMRVTYVPLNVEAKHISRRSSTHLERLEESKLENITDEDESYCSSNYTTSDDETDYYAHERDGFTLPSAEAKPKKPKKKKKKRSASARSNDENSLKRRCIEDLVGSISMSYICKLHPRPGALNLEACVERGVKPGPLLGKLKAGEDVTLPNGQVVKSSDVTSPDDPGPVFIVIECPDERFLDPLESNTQFSNHQSCGASSPDDLAFLVVHFTPSNIISNPRYKKWMDKFPSTTHHLIINENNNCMGSIAVHRIQHKLHLINQKVFPLLSANDIPVLEHNNYNSDQGCFINGSHDFSVNNSLTTNGTSANLETSVYHGKTFSIVNLRPNQRFSSSNELKLNLEEYNNEVFQIEGMKEALETLHQSMDSSVITNNDSKHEYPSVIFLGTGSCIPNKTRNTSGILLNMSDDCCMLLDCGEGTYGQLVRFFGNRDIKKVMSSMKAIFISHLHADHHIGLLGVLKARLKYTCKSGTDSPLYLFAPKQIMTWLRFYNDHFEPVLQQVQLLPNQELVYNNITLSNDIREKVFGSMDLVNVLTAGVRHCPNSFGVSIKHQSGWKITYSGDTMPCDHLVDLGKNSDVLIHEATMEDALEHEARIKMHSTTSEAIEIGKKMNAKFTLLTHFSQRYATLPRFNTNIKENVGIAFDNMKVSLSDLPSLPLMYPALQLMFSFHQDELEQKAYRRQMKQLKMSPAASRSPSPTI